MAKTPICRMKPDAEDAARHEAADARVAALDASL
jgi:hypothetical protein